MGRDLPVSIKTQYYYSFPTTEFYYPYIIKGPNEYSRRLMNFSIYETMLKLNKSLIMPDIPTVVEGSYQIKNNQRGIFSLLLHALADFGGAHPMTMAKSLTFDIISGKEYKLYELFKPKSNYQEVLGEMVYAQLKERDFPLFEDTPPHISEDQDFYIADQTLVIYYQLYEIAPYAAGFPYAVIPIYALEDLLPKDGLISNMGFI